MGKSIISLRCPGTDTADNKDYNPNEKSHDNIIYKIKYINGRAQLKGKVPSYKNGGCTLSSNNLGHNYNIIIIRT